MNVRWRLREPQARVRSPVSRASLSLRFSTFDLVWALASPWLALWARGVPSLNEVGPVTFFAAAFVASAIAFLVFRIRDGMTYLFSVHDALEVAKAVALTECLTFVVLFSVTRLDGIPRSTPIIHALILGAGLITGRAFVRMFRTERDSPLPGKTSFDPEYVVLVGSNRLSSLYMAFLHAYAPHQYQFVAVLDERPEMIGRSVGGVKVLGPPLHLGALIEEFREHGIRTDRVLVGEEAEVLGKETVDELSEICAEHQVLLQFIPELIGLNVIRSERKARAGAVREQPAAQFLPGRKYLSFKRYADFASAALLLICTSPLFLLATLLVLLDMGPPVFYWQRRIGMHGRTFQLHKFRTLKPSFDQLGQPVPNTQRVSAIGAFLRRFRLDELPQLLNVLVGDMSIIGPRPLLPVDQPDNPTIRLSVRPGITGWAQVNGGKLLDAESKNKLDEWYVQNASIWLDLKILFATAAFVFRGEEMLDQSASQPNSELSADDIPVDSQPSRQNRKDIGRRGRSAPN